jgi:hypothetical protein
MNNVFILVVKDHLSNSRCGGYNLLLLLSGIFKNNIDL